MLLVDTSTGTVLTAHTCVIIHAVDLTDEEWEALDGMSDEEIRQLARERGKPLPTA